MSFIRRNRTPAHKLRASVRVVRGYYLLEEFSEPSAGEARLLRRFWFDRVGGIRLARLQSFNDQGLLITDVSYWDEKPFGEAAQFRLPSRIEITRPHDHYKLSIAYQTPAAVEIDQGIPTGSLCPGKQMATARSRSRRASTQQSRRYPLTDFRAVAIKPLPVLTSGILANLLDPHVAPFRLTNRISNC